MASHDAAEGETGCPDCGRQISVPGVARCGPCSATALLKEAEQGHRCPHCFGFSCDLVPCPHCCPRAAAEGDDEEWQQFCQDGIALCQQERARAGEPTDDTSYFKSLDDAEDAALAGLRGDAAHECPGCAALKVQQRFRACRFCQQKVCDGCYNEARMTCHPCQEAWERRQQ